MSWRSPLGMTDLQRGKIYLRVNMPLAVPWD